MTMRKRFTYGDQFDPAKSPLTDLLRMAIEYQPGRYELQQAIMTKYFEGYGQDKANRTSNSKKMAMNCLLSMNAYGLIQLANHGESYTITALGHELAAMQDNLEAMHRRFAVHILTDLEGLRLARMVERIRARGEQVSLEYLGEEFNKVGISIPPNSTYISTMRQWLAEVGVFRPTGYEVNWDVIYDLLNMDEYAIARIYSLTSEQKHFLLSMVNLDAREWMSSNKVAKHTRSLYKIRLTTKNLVKDVLEPLVNTGLIEKRKTTTGRGAKPDDVRLTEKGEHELLQPLLNNLVKVTDLTSVELNRPFEDVVAELKHQDKHIRGKALELLAVWIMRLLGLRFSKWRLRSYESTGGGEVDVMAASDKIVYSRWQIQCKNTKSAVGVEVIAKEVGLTFLTKADIVMVVTTGRFATEAVNYSNLVTDNTRYYVILLEGDDIRRIAADRTSIVDILNIKARRTFAKRELGQSAFDDSDEELKDLEELETEAELEQEIRNVAERAVLNPSEDDITNYLLQ